MRFWSLMIQVLWRIYWMIAKFGPLEPLPGKNIGNWNLDLLGDDGWKKVPNIVVVKDGDDSHGRIRKKSTTKQIQLSRKVVLVFWGFTLSQIPTLKNVEKSHTSKLHFTTNITSYRASTQKQKIIIFHSPSRFGNHSLSAIPRKKEINIIYIISSSPKFCKTTFFQHKPNL